MGRIVIPSAPHPTPLVSAQVPLPEATPVVGISAIHAKTSSTRIWIIKSRNANRLSGKFFVADNPESAGTV